MEASLSPNLMERGDRASVFWGSCLEEVGGLLRHPGLLWSPSSSSRTVACVFWGDKDQSALVSLPE